MNGRRDSTEEADKSQVDSGLGLVIEIIRGENAVILLVLLILCPEILGSILS